MKYCTVSALVLLSSITAQAADQTTCYQLQNTNPTASESDALTSEPFCFPSDASEDIIRNAIGQYLNQKNIDFKDIQMTSWSEVDPTKKL